MDNELQILLRRLERTEEEMRAIRSLLEAMQADAVPDVQPEPEKAGEPEEPEGLPGAREGRLHHGMELGEEDERESGHPDITADDDDPEKPADAQGEAGRKEDGQVRAPSLSDMMASIGMVPGGPSGEAVRPAGGVPAEGNGNKDRMPADRKWIDRYVPDHDHGRLQTPASESKRPPERPLATPEKQAFPKQQPFNFEQQFTIWLPRVFMFILLLGVLWGLKVSFDMGWITQGTRVMLGYLASILLGYLGYRSIRRDRRGFGLTLWGGTIALGILTTFAANQLYGFLPLIPAFVIGIGYIAAGLYASVRTDSETLTVFTAIAGFLLPFLLEGEGASAVMFCVYVLILFLALFGVSIRRHHRVTFYIVFVLSNLTLFSYLVMEGLRDGHENLVAGTALVQHLVLLFFYLKGSIPRHIFTEVLLYLNFAAGLIWIAALAGPVEQAAYGVLAVLYAALAVYAKLLQDPPLQDVLSAMAVAASAIFILSFSPDDPSVILMALLIIGAAGIWTALRLRANRTLAVSGLLYAVNAATTVAFRWFDAVWSPEHAAWLMLLGTSAVIYAAFYKYRPAWAKPSELDGSLIAGQLILMLYLFRLSGVFMQDAGLAFGPEWHIRIGLLGLLAFGSFSLQRTAHGRYVAFAGAIELLLLGAVLLVLPMSNWGGGGYWISLAVGLLFTAGFTYLFRAAARKRFAALPELKPSALAFALQAIYFVFLNKWFFSAVGEFNWHGEAILFTHTVLLFLFAFASITAGRQKKWKAVGAAGFTLLVLSFFKLFVVDMAAVSVMIRAVLFTAVGVAGLIYSRTLLGKQKGNDQEEGNR
ncbi:DUF2339 domain-containing protein [Edaphobacillus lindanitolerans]|uniref:Predicted membrane protein n=1 Tax=Edaphobacillus lindanitolerans TaxID=550447 RepID=A0A1U7PTI7_9BACI|nr:DUF2339 domain-containing protein [Edaphobacillus lindanitolerans]SIT92628.1 Predicted membrane protein [Edaphobacillus lindanitolerans]